MATRIPKNALREIVGTVLRRFAHRCFALAVIASSCSAALAEHYSLPLFVASTAPGTAQGVLRIVNGSGESGSVEIRAIDDAGTRYGPVAFTLNAGTAVEFDASDLASGNATKGLSAGLGTLSGDVRLEIETALQIVPSAYVRAADGTLSAMHDTVRAAAAAGGGGGYRYEVPIFNAASDVTQESRLRLINPGDRAATVTVEGRDDSGAVATGGTVRLTLPAGGARTLTAQQLEAGDSGAMNRTGQLGAGVGRWRLSVSSDRPIRVVNVVSATSGYLNNLSTTAVPGAAPADHEAFSERYGAGGIEYRRGNERIVFKSPEADRFTEAGESADSAFTNVGSFRYEAIRPDAGLVTLLYDDGGVCRANLYFESPVDGRFASLCTGINSPDGFWSGGTWTALGSGGTVPGDPSTPVQESDCHVGLLVGTGESCTYPGSSEAFAVNARGRGGFLGNLAGIRLNVENEAVGGQVFDFAASHQGDGVWRVDRLAGRTAVPTFGDTPNPADQAYMAGTAIDPLTLPEASGGDGRLTYSLSPDVPGLSFSSSTRRLGGTPTTAGTYAMTYTATDTDGDTDTLGFTITVAAADEDPGVGEGEGDGEDEGDDEAERATEVVSADCGGRRMDATRIVLGIVGTVRANRSVTNVRVLGFANDVYFGVDSLGDMPAGSTREFAVAGFVTTASNDISCSVDVHFVRGN